MKIEKAIQILSRRAEHLRARTKPDDTGKDCDMAEIAALDVAIECLKKQGEPE